VTAKKRNFEEATMGRQSSDRNFDAGQTEKRATRPAAETDLSERYRRIGITSVAAAVKFQGDRHNAKQADSDIDARRSKTRRR